MSLACFNRSPENVAKGYTRHNLKRINTTFDFETFELIRAQAQAAGISVSEQVRILVEWGLESESLAR